MNIPEKLKYATTDEWIAADGTVGITDFAQHELGDIVDLEFTVKAGDKITRGQVIANIDSVKASSPICAPVDGEVTATNPKINENCAIINESPYEAAWMFKIKIADAKQLDALLDAAGYKAKIEA
ncbi:MAG: glycine cleavage system protein H [Planctomycetota bacterium]